MASPGLPTNIDTTYADSGSDATVKTHQQHHDAIHAIVNQFDLATPVNALYAPQGNRPTLMGMGDSITENCGNLYSASTGNGTGQFPATSWHLWGQLISGGRFIHQGNAATSGYTIQQIKTAHLPTVIAAKPRYCTVLAGQNNLSALSSTDLTDLASIYSQLLAAGITPILCTNPPTTTIANLFTLNQFISRYARDYGLPLVDFYGALVVGSTGLYLAADTADGTHPTQTGAKKMGQALATVIQGLIPNSWVPFATANVGQTTLVPNPIFLQDNAASPPFPTSGWSELTTNAVGAYSFTTPGGTVAGRAWTLTRPTGVDNNVATSSFTVAAGHRMLTAVKISSTVASVGGSLLFWLLDGSSNSYIQWTLTQDIPSGSAFVHEWTVPSGLPSYSLQYQVRVTAGNAATATLAQFTTVDLTAIGAA